MTLLPDKLKQFYYYFGKNKIIHTNNLPKSAIKELLIHFLKGI